MKVFSLLVMLCCLVFGSTACAADKRPMGFLFVIDSAYGSLTHLSGKKFQLSVPIKDIKSVLAFSNRPYRKHFKLSQAEYAKLVYSGKNSFRDDPPNIALVWANQKAHVEVYILTGYSQVKNNVVYSLTWQAPSSPVAKIKNRQGRVAVFIDPLEINELEICMYVSQQQSTKKQSAQQLRKRGRDEVRKNVRDQRRVCGYGR